MSPSVCVGSSSLPQATSEPFCFYLFSAEENGRKEHLALKTVTSDQQILEGHHDDQDPCKASPCLAAEEKKQVNLDLIFYSVTQNKLLVNLMKWAESR